MKSETCFRRLLIPALIVVLAAGFSAPSAMAAKVIIGALNDMTGATSDVGKDYALGIAEAYRYVNDNGGINGKEIKLYQFDYGYRIPEALTKYNLFKRLKCKLVVRGVSADRQLPIRVDHASLAR